MPTVRCPGCATRLTMSEEQFLKRVRCNTCSMEFFPGGASLAGPPSGQGRPKPKTQSKPAVVNKPVTVNEPIVPPPLPRPKPAPRLVPIDRDDADFGDDDVDVATLRGQFTRIRIGLLLCAIAHWCTLGAVLLCCLFLIVIWSGDRPIEQRNILVGFPGLVSCICMAIGGGFAVSGVQRYQAVPYAIGLCVATLWHFFVVAVIAFAMTGDSSPAVRHRPRLPTNSMPRMPARVESDEDAFSAPTTLVGARRNRPIQLFATSLPLFVHGYGILGERLHDFATLGVVLTYQVEIHHWGIGALTILAGLADVARWVMLALWMRAVAKCSKAHSQEDSPYLIAIGLPAGLVLLALLNLLLGAFARPESREGAKAVAHTMFLLQLIQLLWIAAAATTAAVLLHQLMRSARYRKPVVTQRAAPSIGGAF